MLLAAFALMVVTAVPAAAQPPTFSQAYQVRGALGDIPSTTQAEPAGTWNLEQRLTVQFTNTTPATHAFNVPAGAHVVNTTCTCNPSHSTVRSDSVVFTIDTSVPAGSYTMTVLTSQPVGTAFGFSIAVPIEAGPQDRVAVLYVPGSDVWDAPVKPVGDPLVSTDGSARIVYFTSFPDQAWFAIHPATANGATSAANPMTGWLVAAALGLVVGIVLWALLVSRGVVQAKGRRQVAGTAAHVEAAAADPPAVLEGRKRALLAALKEIEVAKMNGEMPNEVYDVVKADLKRQAVTVMRALESGTAAGDAPSA
jgi:hypothetical protein